MRAACGNSGSQGRKRNQAEEKGQAQGGKPSDPAPMHSISQWPQYIMRIRDTTVNSWGEATGAAANLNP